MPESDDEKPPSADAATAAAVMTAVADVAKPPSVDDPDAALDCVAVAESERLSELAAAETWDCDALADVESALRPPETTALPVLPLAGM